MPWTKDGTADVGYAGQGMWGDDAEGKGWTSYYVNGLHRGEISFYPVRFEDEDGVSWCVEWQSHYYTVDPTTGENDDLHDEYEYGLADSGIIHQTLAHAEERAAVFGSWDESYVWTEPVAS